jgi:hypothetical protein
MQRKVIPADEQWLTSLKQRTFDLNGDGELSAADLVQLPRALYRALLFVFGVSCRCLPATALVGLGLAFIGGTMFANGFLVAADAYEQSFVVEFAPLRAYIALFLLITLLVDGLVVAHGLLVGAYSTSNFLCASKGSLSCGLKKTKCAACVKCLLWHVTAAGRGAFGLFAAAFLWISVALAILFSFTAAFSLVLTIALKATCAALEDTEAISSLAGNTTVVLLEQRFNSSALLLLVDEFALAGSTDLSFLPVEVGTVQLGSPIRAKIAAMIEEAKLSTAESVEDVSAEYLLQVQQFCEPLLLVKGHLRHALIGGLVALVGQICMLIAHQTTFTIYAYELQLDEAAANSRAAARRQRLQEDEEARDSGDGDGGAAGAGAIEEEEEEGGEGGGDATAAGGGSAEAEAAPGAVGGGGGGGEA